MKKKMKVAPTKLTDLPERAIHEILCRIPVAEAVRTCVLSRAWRRRWQSVPDLDLKGLPNQIASQILLLHSGNIRLLKAETNGDHSTVYCWLSGLSVRAAGSTLRTLHLLGLDSHLLSIDCYFPNLTHLRLAGGTQYLPRNFSRAGFKALHSLHLRDATFHGKLSTLFSTCPLLEVFSLVNIDLEERQRLDIFAPNLRLFEMKDVGNLDELAVISDGDLFGLKNLRILHFESVPFHGNLSILLSACTLLETTTVVEIDSKERQCLDIFAPKLRQLNLTLVSYAISSVGGVAGLKSLRTLLLSEVMFNGHLSMLFSACPLLEEATLLAIRLEERQCLNIVAPNLRLLKIGNMKNLNEFSVTSAPVLEVAVLDCLFDGDDDRQVGTSGDCKVMKVLGGMPNVKKLTLSNGTIKYLVDDNIQGQLPFSFKHLMFLSLEVNFACELEALLSLSLFKSSPNLEAFEYKGLSYNDSKSKGIGGGVDFWKAQEDLVFGRLKTVNMIDIRGAKAEYDLIRILPAKSRLFEKMMISKVRE